MAGTRPSSAEDAESGWLNTPAGQAFCWYHPPQGLPRQAAVLLCDPLGSDRMNLHLAYRYLALALSERGYPVLRLDYPGTCDAEGSPRDPDRLTAMLQALHAGADFLSARAGTSTLILFGARFGGTVAERFARERPSVSHLVLWGAYPTGRQFLRTETTFDRMMASNPEGRQPSHWEEGDREAAGFLYTRETAESVSALRMESVQRDVQALVFDWDDAGDGATIVERLGGDAGQVTHAGLPDPGSASLRRQRVPTALIEHAGSWLDTRIQRAAPEATAEESPSLAREVIMDTGAARSVREQCLHVGREADLFGILTTPAESDSAEPTTAILLVNGGNNHRPGINRNYTEWARAWAKEGFAVLRMDIRGLGDSPPLKNTDLNRLYMKRTVNDVEQAVEWLKTTGGYERIVLCGYCAGAYQALHLARRVPEIDALLLVELLRYYAWEPLQNAERDWQARLMRYWARLHPMWLLDRGRIGRWLADLTRRGVRTLVVYRHDERMLTRFESEVEKSLADLNASDRFELARLSSSNHILSPLFAQEELSGVLKDFLNAGTRIQPSG